MEQKKQLTRSEVNQSLTWDIEAIFPSVEIYEETFKGIENNRDILRKFRGHLGDKPEMLNDFLEAYMKTEQVINVMAVYAHLLVDQDTGNSENLARYNKLIQLSAEVDGDFAFVRPELMAMGKEKIEEFMKKCPGLVTYKKYFDNLLRFEPHTLSEKEERILAMASPVLTTGYRVFSLLDNADLKFRNAKDSKGEEHEVTHSSYGRLIESRDRQLRKSAFESHFASYKDFSHTYAATLGAQVKSHNLNAVLRDFSSARAAAVFENNIPESVQENLINTVHENIGVLHDYVAFRKEKLGVDKLYSYDLYPSLVKDVDMTFTIEEAQKIIIEALKPLGEKYRTLLEKAFKERWIDWVDNKGKRSGAYSSGTYGTNPYILISWQGTLDNVYTLAHELGHSLHSYLTWENQPYHYANYCIFLAEIASTTNENLLTNYFLEKYKDNKEIQAYILNHYLDGVKGTVFRQTQFAEFEQLIHIADQKGLGLTVDSMCKAYQDINQQFYGPALEPTEEISYEWARIPHFYYNFYVYQYATGFSAATAFASAIVEEGQPAVERYLNFLSSGSSKYPIQTLKDAGVDMTTSQPIIKTIEKFGAYFEKLKKLI